MRLFLLELIEAILKVFGVFIVAGILYEFLGIQYLIKFIDKKLDDYQDRRREKLSK